METGSEDHPVSSPVQTGGLEIGKIPTLQHEALIDGLGDGTEQEIAEPTGPGGPPMLDPSHQLRLAVYGLNPGAPHLLVVCQRLGELG